MSEAARIPVALLLFIWYALAYATAILRRDLCPVQRATSEDLFPMVSFALVAIISASYANFRSFASLLTSLLRGITSTTEVTSSSEKLLEQYRPGQLGWMFPQTPQNKTTLEIGLMMCLYNRLVPAQL